MSVQLMQDLNQPYSEVKKMSFHEAVLLIEAAAEVGKQRNEAMEKLRGELPKPGEVNMSLDDEQWLQEGGQQLLDLEKKLKEEGKW